MKRFSQLDYYSMPITTDVPWFFYRMVDCVKYCKHILQSICRETRMNMSAARSDPIPHDVLAHEHHCMWVRVREREKRERGKNMIPLRSIKRRRGGGNLRASNVDDDNDHRWISSSELWFALQTHQANSQLEEGKIWRCARFFDSSKIFSRFFLIAW